MMTRKQITETVKLAKTGDAWTKGYATETLKVRLNDTKDAKEAQLIRLALANIGG